MNREYHRWFSPSLSRDMELIVLGHAGAKVLCFPTSCGRFFEWEDRGIFNTVRESIDRGLLQICCVDSVDIESWYATWAHPAGRAYRHSQYDGYLCNEVVPFMNARNDNRFFITLGASFGAYHAMTFGLKHPELVSRILAFSGLYDIRRFTGGYTDDNVYFNNPVQFIPNEEGWRLARLRDLDIIIASGRDDRLIEHARTMSNVLWNHGIGNALREWDGWSHDWPYWEQMLSLYIGGHD